MGMYNSKLTIIITTFNRSEKISQLLAFFAKTKVNSKIIISDCSFEENVILNNAIIDEYVNILDIYHLILPSRYCNYEAFYYALNSVDTKYVVLSADDDFLIYKSLLHSVIFLEKEPSYVACQGKQFFFTKKYNHILFGKSYMVERSIDDSTAELRIESTMIKNDRFYAPKSVFSVMRSDMTKKIYFDALSLGLDHSNTEGLVNRLILISGKIKLLSSLYIVREHGMHNAGLIAKIRYTKIINNQFGYQSFQDLNLNEKIIVSDKELKIKESYKETKLRIKFLCIKYILNHSKLREIEAEKIFNKWFDLFSVSKNQTNNKYIDGLSLLLNSIFYNIYPFGRVNMIRKILKKKLNYLSIQ